jgi:transcription elongation factor Elf1
MKKMNVVPAFSFNCFQCKKLLTVIHTKHTTFGKTERFKCRDCETSYNITPIKKEVEPTPNLVVPFYLEVVKIG